MSDNPHKKFTEALPLWSYAEMITKAYEKMGHHVVVSVHVGDLETGAVTSASNMEAEQENDLLAWILQQRRSGGIEVTRTGDEIDKEKLN